ncbi:peptidase domain-containing ABC transporter [Chitinophaga sp. Cy-1792]|uniref:peptidase domain-containing ABC transporter n=1 Tax=Chitinophaga sp. Cy-1792 TaxID=2608339 RepID=UPI0014226438|nr:peptidase domain-containing ABC transporter [Chitinophaga sp. Cy-1792]NIG56554.1 peptidase domain-containing ABC transporter [Chitinophaga sp. Cy-1792]
MSKQFPFFKQLDQMDCGPTCLKMITSYYGKNIDRDYLREKAALNKTGVSMAGIAEAAENLGIQSLVVLSDYEMLANEIPLPCIAFWRQRHFIVVYKIDNKNVYVADPAFGLIKYSKEEFLKGWLTTPTQGRETSEGVLMVLEPGTEFHESEEEQQKKSKISFLFPFITPYRKLIIQLFIGLFIGSIIQLIFPFLTQAIVDIGINQNNLNFINLVLLGQLVLFISRTFTEILRSWLLLHITTRVNISLLSNFLRKLMKLPIAYFDTKTIGDLLQRIQDNSRIQTFLSTTSLNVLFSSFSIIIFGIVLCYYSIPIFIILITAIIVNSLWVAIFLKRRAALDYKRFDQAAGNQSSTIQLLNGMQEIKLNNSERRRRWEWELIQVRLFKLSMKSLSLSQMQDIGGSFVLQLMNIFITFYAAKQVIYGDFSLGTMLSIQFIIGQVNLPINSFIGFMQASQDARISLERLAEIHNKENEVLPDANLLEELPKNKDIVLKNVCFRYGANSSPWILDNIDLIIPEGKVTAIVGASGSGKTTLLKLILQYYTPDQGGIYVGPHNLNNFHSDHWRRNIGVVMQDGYIFADTIARNVTESDSDGILSRERLQGAIKVANIEGFIEELPNGFKTRIGSSGMSISGGQRQRILIARAVYKDPAFLLFDEATSSLDANNEAIIMENLEDFYRNKTVLIVAHRLSTVKNADQIIVLEKGRIIEQGDHHSLTQKKGAYYTLIKNQLELGQ